MEVAWTVGPGGGQAGVMTRLAVYCGSSSGTSEAFRQAAHDLGTELGGRGIELVYGGGNVGLMGVVAEAVLAGGGAVTGVITRFLVEKEVAHHGLTNLEVVGSMHERKARMAAQADGVIALPGGFGTLDEVFEILTWSQLGLVTLPVVFLDVAGYWSPLLDALASMSAAGFVRTEHLALARRATTPSEAVDRALEPLPGPVHKWVDRA